MAKTTKTRRAPAAATRAAGSDILTPSGRKGPPTAKKLRLQALAKLAVMQEAQRKRMKK